MTGMEQNPTAFNGNYQMKTDIALYWKPLKLRFSYFNDNPSCDVGSRDIILVPDELSSPYHDLVEIPKDDNSIHCQIRKISEYVNSNLQVHVCIIMYLEIISISIITLKRKLFFSPSSSMTVEIHGMTRCGRKTKARPT